MSTATPHKRLGIAVGFVWLLIALKVLYLAAESYYNAHLVDVATSLDADRDRFEALEAMGHRLSSIGLTLLAMPLFYLIGRRLARTQFQAMAAASLLALLSYHGLYAGLERLMEKIVELNQEKRYEAYYATALRYGMLAQSMGYTSFLPQERLGNLQTEDRVMLANIFLLTQLEPALVDRIVDEGRERFVDILILQHDRDAFDKEEVAFKAQVGRIAEAWNGYVDARAKINASFEGRADAATIQKAYDDFKRSLNERYAKYGEGVTRYERELNAELAKGDGRYDELKRYFRYRRYASAKRKYRESMLESFGYEVPPERWCAHGRCPDRGAVDSVIEQEVRKRFETRSRGLPPNLNKRAFFLHPKVKKEVIAELAKQGIRVRSDFNYSAAQFATAYKQMVKREFKRAVAKMQEGFEADTGIKRVRTDLDHDAFVALFTPQFKERFSKPRYTNAAITMAQQGDTSGFYEQIYRPQVHAKVMENVLYPRSTFENDPEAMRRGDDAIKMLFIPPFAIFLSLFAGLLNLASLLGMLYALALHGRRGRWVSASKLLIKTLLVALIVYLPYRVAMQEGVLERYPALSHDTPFLRYYRPLLAWLLVAERANYDLFYTGR
ncbi:hypothetical protein LOH54_05805 [Sulfurimonas sp. HSL-3221]|uniref:hypothetical protein n=1 Tax=Thiomicrolovo sulfuroxydans TaxID=2894755 RepID=UPI001E5ED111|nr:hypothetical protein [Sulfurimonas sp. HSL-3221]UFS63645.1 hypothetical protein LOH54_05805 [Sulfurimonas sp. HSL-3221]